MSPTRITIRPAKKADLAEIVRLYTEDELLGKQPGAPRLPGERRHRVSETHEAAFEAIAANPDNGVYVAEAGDQVVGTFQLTFIRQLTYGGCLVAQLESVFVDGSARSLGVGTTMMEFAREEAEHRGALRLQLTSNLARQRAHRFYERLGFQHTHQGMKLYLQPERARKAEG